MCLVPAGFSLHQLLGPGAGCHGARQAAEGASGSSPALPAAGKERPVCAQPAQGELEDEVDQKTIWLSPHWLN